MSRNQRISEGRDSAVKVADRSQVDNLLESRSNFIGGALGVSHGQVKQRRIQAREARAARLTSPLTLANKWQRYSINRLVD